MRELPHKPLRGTDSHWLERTEISEFQHNVCYVKAKQGFRNPAQKQSNPAGLSVRTQYCWQLSHFAWMSIWVQAPPPPLFHAIEAHSSDQSGQKRLKTDLRVWISTKLVKNKQPCVFNTEPQKRRLRHSLTVLKKNWSVVWNLDRRYIIILLLLWVFPGDRQLQHDYILLIIIVIATLFDAVSFSQIIRIISTVLPVDDFEMFRLVFRVLNIKRKIISILLVTFFLLN